jgi:hypothetical protein
MVFVHAAVGAADACGNPSITLLSIGSSEPDDVPGGSDGETPNDIQGVDAFDFWLRAERNANGGGRTYAAIYRAVDASGNSVSAGATAFVPHDLGGLTEPLALSLVQNATGTVVEWAPVQGASRYTIARGNVKYLRLEGDAYRIDPLVCILADTTQTSTLGSEDWENPVLGESFFYVAEFDGALPSGYGTETATRDRSAFGAGDCP